MAHKNKARTKYGTRRSTFLDAVARAPAGYVGRPILTTPIHRRRGRLRCRYLVRATPGVGRNDFAGQKVNHGRQILIEALVD